MPVMPNRSESSAPAESPLAARNRELLQLRDPALNLAFRISGNAADAEDILQDAYLRAVKAASPILTGSPLRNWFFQITANAARDWLRSERSRRNREKDAAMNQNAFAESPGLYSAGGELKMQVEAELARLDEKYRMPISLHYEHGLSYDDAAEVLGLTSGTLRVYVSQGIQELREKLDVAKRPVSAEILVGLLGAGLLLTASPALAASVDAIVASGTQAAATGAASAATGTAKTVGTGAKPFVVLATKSGVPFPMVSIGLAVAASVAFVTALGLKYWLLNPHKPEFVQPALHATPPANLLPVVPDKNEIDLTDCGAPRTAFERRVFPIKYLYPHLRTNSPLFQSFTQALVAVKTPNGTISYEAVETQIQVHFYDRPDALLKMQRILEKYDVPDATALATTVPTLAVPATDYKPSAQTEAAWALADDLMPLIDVEHHAMSGTWLFDGAKLVGKAGKFARIAIPYAPPEEYDLRIDFTRTLSGGDVNLMFPAEGRDRIFKMESWSSSYFGERNGNPDTAPMTLANGVRHTAVVEVRRGTLAAYVDGKLTNKIVTALSSSACTADWRLSDRRMIGIGAWFNEVAVQRLAVRAVTGRGAPLPADADLKNAVSEEYWKDALDLMPQALDAKNAPAGNWQLNQQHELSTDAVRNARMQLNYAPPEEYDFRIDFMRREGVGEVSQIIAAGGRQFIWKMDIAGVSIFDTIGKMGRNNNPTALQIPSLIPNGITHSSVVCVRKHGVRAYVDGKSIDSHDTLFKDMAIEASWMLPAPDALGVGFHNCSGVFYKIRVKEVTGKGSTPTGVQKPAIEKSEF